jgi:hypothetical protein
MSNHGKVYTSITSKEETVDVSRARALLASRGDHTNRPISKAVVKKYCVDVAKGDWPVTGETMKIDWFGRMIDGQHRCTAVIETGKSIQTIMVYGVDPNCFVKIDRGQRRNNGHILHISGSLDGKRASAAISNIIGYDLLVGGKAAPSSCEAEQALEFWHLNRDIEDAIVLAKAAKNGWTNHLNPSIGDAFAFYAARAGHNEDVVRDFLACIGHGAIPNIRDPRLLLRNDLIKQRQGGKTLPPLPTLGFVIDAFNQHVAGKKRAQEWAKKSSKHYPKVISKGASGK